jgi:Rieske 2Fe-2S family protein
LYPIAVELWQGFVFVRLDAAGETLVAQLGALPERVRPYPLASLRVGARAERMVDANWKILVENFMECYHCPGVLLAQESEVADVTRWCLEQFGAE